MWMPPEFSGGVFYSRDMEKFRKWLIDKYFQLMYYMDTKSGIASKYLQLKNERRKNMATNSGFDREVRFNIVEHIGVLSTHSTGWNKELNLVSWNGGQPKYDIRDWDMDHEHMSRGVTLHEKEMRQIFELMKKRRVESRFRKEEQPAMACAAPESTEDTMAQPSECAAPEPSDCNSHEHEDESELLDEEEETF